MRSKHAHLFEDAQVRRWYENVARGSKTTADVYLRDFGRFLIDNGTSPDSLLRMQQDELHGLLLDAVTAMEERKLTGGYVTTVLKAVKSWLSFNGVVVTRKIRVRGAHETPTLRDERVPTQEELRQILLSDRDAARAVCVLLAHSGLRPEVLGSSTADDGLRIRDLPDLAIEGTSAVFHTIPALVRVRCSLSKNGRDYFTFLGEEGCEYVKTYLDGRIRAGESLGPDSAVVAPKTARHPFLCTTKVSAYARGAMRRAGVTSRPYVLRSYFDTQMMLAESKGADHQRLSVVLHGAPGRHRGGLHPEQEPTASRHPRRDAQRLRESSALSADDADDGANDDVGGRHDDVQATATLGGRDGARRDR